MHDWFSADSLDAIVATGETMKAPNIDYMARKPKNCKHCGKTALMVPMGKYCSDRCKAEAKARREGK
jgi:hypothetical protein